MLKYILIYTLIVSSLYDLQGQNLIPNGGFEKINHKVINKIVPTEKNFNRFFTMENY